VRPEGLKEAGKGKSDCTKEIIEKIGNSVLDKPDSQWYYT
jgi:hypothetical protein